MSLKKINDALTDIRFKSTIPYELFTVKVPQTLPLTPCHRGERRFGTISLFFCRGVAGCAPELPF